MSKPETSNQATTKRVKVSQTEFPNSTLQQAMRIAQAIWDGFAGKGAAPHQIAVAIGMSPTSGTWRNLCGSSIAYGLTEGGCNAAQIGLADLGRRIVAPTHEGEDAKARVEASLKPRVLSEFFRKYNKAKFPKDDIAKNVLVSYGLPKERADAAFLILKENAEYTGVVLQTKSGPFVAIDNPSHSASPGPCDQEEPAPEGDGDVVVLSTKSSQAAHSSAAPPTKLSQIERPKQLFVAHGKNRKPLEELKKILSEFKIPFKIAVDEANAGRPISAKVAELMNECSAGVFIFTRDEQFFRKSKDGEHEEVWRPSENVVYELGAASILWERKIIILREDGVNFPSDFGDLGWITFKDGQISTKALELLKELVALGLVKFQAA
jgi:predicted nucleotide-binding protein